MHRHRFVHAGPCCALGLALLLGPVHAQPDETKDQYRCDLTKLEFDFTGLPKLTRRKPHERDTWRAQWTGEDADHSWTVTFHVYDHAEYHLRDPFAALLHVGRAGQSAEGKRAVFAERMAIDVAGSLPHAFVGITRPGKSTAMQFVLAGVTDTHAYGLEVRIYGVDPNRNRDQALQFFKSGVRYSGVRWDPNWSDGEARARWKKAKPDKMENDELHIVRTKHYIFMTNSKAVRAYAKSIEACHKKISKLLPIESAKGRRLMPVFLFHHSQEFVYYLAKATGEAQSGPSASYFDKDFYATWNDRAQPEHHMRGVTWQYLRNRLHMKFGGQWFTEGLCNYLAFRKREIKSAVAKAQKDNLVPDLKTFMTSRIWTTDANRTKTNYALAASLIGCVRESRWGKKRFLDFVRMMGSYGHTDIAAVEKALKSLFGFDLAEFEQRWKRHWR